MSQKKKKPVEAAAPSRETKLYRDAVAHLDKGDLVRAVRGFMRVLEEYPATEEAHFCEEQIGRLLQLYPSQMQEAAFDAGTFATLKAERRKAPASPPGLMLTVAFLFAATAWCLMLAFAPRAALIGRGPEVPLIFRALAGVGGGLGGYIAYGFLRHKWEAVNIFVVWLPPLMILSFIGVLEAPDLLGRLLAAAALAAQLATAWYVAQISEKFIL